MRIHGNDVVDGYENSWLQPKTKTYIYPMISNLKARDNDSIP